MGLNKKLYSKILALFSYLFLLTTIGYTQNINTIAGTIGQPGYSGDGGTAINARFNHPMGLAVDNIGNIYVFDQLNVVIRKITPTGIITTIAGNGTVGYSGDGGPAIAAQLSNHYSGNPAVDDNGNIYIADAGNFVIRKIDPTGIITTIAGKGTRGYSGDGGPATAAQFVDIRDLAIDNNGNLYVADHGNSRIRKINTSGIISTIAGIGVFGSNGDGGLATSAQIMLTGIAVDNTGNVYFGDLGSSTIRKINQAGIITTIAGNGNQAYSGDGGPAIMAELHTPHDVHIGPDGSIYIADYYNHVIRKIDNTGTITTVVGNNSIGYSGDGGPAISAQINYPLAVWVDRNSSIYISDFWHYHTIRKVNNCLNTLPASVSIHSSATTICPNDAVTFTATPVNGGTSPFYQWKVNGRNAGTNSNIFTTQQVNNGDVVACEMTSSLPCTVPVLSTNSITITVKPAPLVQVMPAVTIPWGGSVQINATVAGAVTSYLWTPATGLNSTSILNPIARPDITTTYILRATGSNGCDGLDSIKITVYKKLFMPSAFTPNNDGKNDVFRIPPGTTFDLKDFSVYNRWGSIVFKTKDINRGWDGKSKGITGDTGTYIFTITGKDKGKEVLIKGTVLLIR